MMAREWPLRQARAQQGPRGSQRDPGGRSLDRGRARRPGPRATDAEGTDRRNVAARPRSRRGAQPRRVGRGRARRPGGWGPWPALSGHGWDPPPKCHAWPPTSRADAQRAEARRAAALGAGATASGVPERISTDRRPPTVLELVPRPVGGRGRHAPSAGPRGGPARILWCWPCRRATGGGVARLRIAKKKLRPRPHRGRNYPISGPNSSEPGVRPPTIGSWQAQRLLHLYYSTVPAKNPDYLDFWQYLHGLFQYCGILLPIWLQIPVTANATREHARGWVLAVLWRGPPRGWWRGVASAGALPPFWGPTAPSPPTCDIDYIN